MHLNKYHKDIVEKFKGDEKKLAQSLVERYLKDYSIETVSDLNTLKEVIYYEIIQSRLQAKLNEFADSKTIPIQLVNIMHANSEQIVKLKNSLGLFAEKEKKTEYDVLKHLKRRFHVWLDENQASRTLICPHCSKMILLKMSTKEWESQKHPFFKDRILYNKELFRLYGEGKISKKDLSLILETSQDYIDWVIQRVEKNYSGIIDKPVTPMLEGDSSNPGLSPSDVAVKERSERAFREPIKTEPISQASPIEPEGEPTRDGA